MSNEIKSETKVLAVSMLAEGNSIRSIERMTGVHRDTIMRLMINTVAGCAGNRVAEIDRAAYAFEQMNAALKSIYLFLSSEKDFASFCCILTKTLKPIETIDAVGLPLFLMLS